MEFDNIDPEDIEETPNGFQYIQVEDDDGNILKLRRSHRADRIKEDDETYDEYQLRRRVIKEYTKDRKKGSVIWPGSFGTLTQEKAEFVRNLAKQQANENSSS